MAVMFFVFVNPSDITYENRYVVGVILFAYFKCGMVFSALRWLMCLFVHRGATDISVFLNEEHTHFAVNYTQVDSPPCMSSAACVYHT